MGSFFDAFPDISHSTGDLDVQGQTVSATVRVTGTHTEPFVMPQGTLPPTGRAIDIRARNEMDVRDDSIGALRITFDAADFMRQLGLGYRWCSRSSWRTSSSTRETRTRFSRN